MDYLKKIGIGLTAFAAFFTGTGIYFFDKGLLVMGVIILISGVMLTVCEQSTVTYFMFYLELAWLRVVGGRMSFVWVKKGAGRFKSLDGDGYFKRHYFTCSRGPCPARKTVDVPVPRVKGDTFQQFRTVITQHNHPHLTPQPPTSASPACSSSLLADSTVLSHRA